MFVAPVRPLLPALPLALTLAAAPLRAQTAAEPALAFETFELANGMTVILHEDHAAPMATVNLWYGVGSKDEPADRTGFAHLFEHLMFMGTERVPGSGFDDLMEAGGGWNNATTSPDRTNYFSVGPAELLPTLLWLDADRLETLGRDMTTAKLDSQRAVVLNEYRQNYENAPYGMGYLASSRLLYPEGHPYHISTIGLPEHIEAAELEDVTDFFARWYVPNNASLVVAGDFDSEAVRPLVEQLFGTLPRGDDPVRRTPPPSWETVRDGLGGAVTHTVVDDVSLPMLMLQWHSPAFYAEGDAELDLLAGVLAGGPASRLYRRLVVDEGLAVDVSAGQQSGELGSVFVVQVLARPDADHSDILRAIDSEIARLANSGPSTEELERERSAVERGMLEGLQSLQAKADLLNQYQHHFGTPDGLARDLARYRRADRREMARWTSRVLGHPNRLSLWILPREQTAPENPRDVRPRALPSGAFRAPAPEVTEVGEGVTWLHWDRPDLPLFAARVWIDSGAAADGDAPGLTSLALGMLSEGAGEFDGGQVADALGLLGAELTATVSDDHAVVALDGLAARATETFAWLEKVLFDPRFDADDFARLRAQRVAAVVQELEQPQAVAARVGRALIFGEGHPLAVPAEGTPDSLGALQLEAARARWAELGQPSRMTLMTAGALDVEALRPELDRIFRARGSVAAATIEPAWGAPEVEPLRLVAVDRPGATQTAIGLWLHAPPYDAPERLDLQMVGTVLGGTFTSRLNSNLREDKGWTYGARARFDHEPRWGRMVATTSVQVDATGPSVRELMGEVRRLATGDATAVEAGKAGRSLRQRSVERLGSLSGLLGAALTARRSGSTLVSLDEALGHWGQNATPERVNAAARSGIDTEHGVLVLVGDADAIVEQLAVERAAGFVLPELEWVDATGRPLSDGPR